MPIAGLRKPSTEAAETVHSALTGPVNAYLQALRSAVHPAPPNGEVPVVHVSNVVSGAAAFYERLRYSLDYREEHLLRRHALERMLLRHYSSARTFEGIGSGILAELVQARYLPNDAIPESIIPQVQRILDRYDAALEAVVLSHQAGSDAPGWLIGLASAELDEFLVPAPEEAALVDLMGSVVNRDNPLADWGLNQEECKVQVFIACYRALFAFDLQTLHFLLLSRQLPSWRETSVSEAPSLVPALLAERAIIDAALAHPAGERLAKSLRPKALVFHVIRDIVEEYGEDEAATVFRKEAHLSTAISETCQQYYQAARRRLFRSAYRSTVYILLTKVMLALLVEAPLEQLLEGAVNPLPLIINLSFPPVLMFLLTVPTGLPGAANTAQVTKLVMAVLYGSDRRIFPTIKPVRRTSAVTVGIFSVIYLIAFGLSFGLTIWFLRLLGFSPVGMGFFLFFLSVVSFFAIRVRQPIRDLFVSRSRENLLAVLINFFSLPVLSLGQWIARTSARFNVFLYLFDYFLEAPLKSFLLVSDEVLGRFRDKREDLL